MHAPIICGNRSRHSWLFSVLMAAMFGVLYLCWSVSVCLETVKGLQHGLSKHQLLGITLGSLYKTACEPGRVRLSNTLIQKDLCPDAFHGRLLRDADVDTPLLLVPDDGHSDHSKRGLKLQVMETAIIWSEDVRESIDCHVWEQLPMSKYGHHFPFLSKPFTTCDFRKVEVELCQT